MGDKSEVITQAKQAEEAIKQEKIQEAAKQEAAGEQKAAAKPATEKKEEKPAEKKAEPKKGEKKEEKKRKLVLERVYTIPLSKAYEKTRSHRGRVAVSLLRQFVAKHSKAPSIDSVSIDGKVNSAILLRGSRNPPKKLRVLVQKDDEGKVLATLAA